MDKMMRTLLVLNLISTSLLTALVVSHYATHRDNNEYKEMVLGDTIERLPTPGNYRLTRLECDGDNVWGHFAWNAVSGADTYGLEVWDANGKYLGIVKTQETSYRMELYTEKDTKVAVIALKAEGEEKNEGFPSDKISFSANDLANECSFVGSEEDSKVEEENTEDDSDEVEDEVEMEIGDEVEEDYVSPSPKPEPTESSDDLSDEDEGDEVGEDSSELESRVDELEDELSETKERQTVLEEIISRILAFFERFI